MATLTPLRSTLALFALVAVLVMWRYSPPAPVGADAPVERFSSARARLVQEALVGDGTTRMTGTAGNTRGREAMIAALTKNGWKVETQEDTACTRYGICTPVWNIVASLDGTEPALAGVLVTAHYDSVLAGPGASDDGVGTAAVVESARALAAGARPKRTIVIVLTDGEEIGLAGADAFVRSHRLASTVRTTVNVDSRGSGGPSQMFETSAGNAGLIALVAEHVDRPVTTSLFYEVYKRMPNDTDFSVTKTIASGVNFANTARVEHYHTPLDDLAHADRGTLQHHGDNVLAMTRAFAGAADAPSRTEAGGGDAVWFDVLAVAIVRWPASWSMLLALIALAFIAGNAIRSRIFDRGLLVFPAMVAPGVLAAVAADALMSGLHAYPSVWTAHPWAGVTAIELAAIAAAVFFARLLASTASPRTLWSGVWLGWAVVGAVLAKIAPGTSYLFIVPALTAGVLGMARLGTAAVTPRALLADVAGIAAAVVAAILLLSLRFSFYDGLGFAVAPLLAVPAILLATTVAPFLPATTKRAAPALGAVSLLLCVVAAIVPKYTSDHPQRVNVAVRQDESTSRVFVDTSWGSAVWGSPPAAMLEAAGTGTAVASVLPWSRAIPFADIPRLDAAPPAFEVTSVTDEGGHHRIRGRVRSPRGAPFLGLFFPRDRHVAVKVDGRSAYTRTFSTGALLALVMVKPEGALVELDATGNGPLPFDLVDRSSGVPPGSKAEAAIRARRPEQAPSQDGDITVLSTKLTL